MASALIAILISLLIGGVAYFITKNNQTIKVSKREFLIGSAISSAVLILMAPLVEHLILSDKMTYYEYFNGYETAAVSERIPCERDGRCTYTYNCDPYIVMVSYTTTDSKGHSRQRMRPETRYHDCPYLKVEVTYTVQTTLGDYEIGGRFAETSRAGFRDEPIPSYIKVGPPALWTDAKNRIAAGKNGGVTKTHAYKNFLLASDKTLLDSYSADIERYKELKMLPPHTANYDNPIYSEYMADKFTLVGLNGDARAWNEALLRLNGYLGKDLQGDVHIVAVNADKVTDRDRYAQALFAYWKSPAFKKYALPKNSVAVVVGVKDNKIAWARATGGLPTGNEGLFGDIKNNLVDVDFAPESVIGIPHKTEGTLTSTLYGTHKFKRPCMECVQEKVDGYAYLKSDITISGWERFWIIFVAVLLSGGMWGLFLYLDDSVGKRYYY